MLRTKLARGMVIPWLSGVEVVPVKSRHLSGRGIRLLQKRQQQQQRVPQQVGAGKVSKPQVLLPAGCIPLVTDLCEASIFWQAWADPVYVAAETAAVSATLLLPIGALVTCVVMRLYQTLLIFEGTCVSQI